MKFCFVCYPIRKFAECASLSGFEMVDLIGLIGLGFC